MCDDNLFKPTSKPQHNPSRRNNQQMTSFASEKLKVYYWPMFGRAGAALRMLEHTGTKYEHISAFPDIAGVCTAFGGGSDTFAPPIVVDGEYQISQSTAVTTYVGQKSGLGAGVDQFKAAQYLADIVDLFEGGIGKNSGAGGAALKIYLEGDGSEKPSRFTKQATNLSRGIKGPYFFGDSPSYVDFFLCQHMDWQDEMCLRRLREEIQLDCFGPYPKIKAVAEGIRNLDSYKNYSGPLKTCGRPGFVKEDDFFAVYKGKKVRAVVLCAGQGSRLRPLTNTVPKCMVKYKGNCIIDYILASLRASGVEDICLVKGYLASVLERKDTTSIVNKDYDKTNMVATLFCAEEQLDSVDDLVLSYSDIIYNPKIVQALLASNADVSVVIDRQWRSLWEARMENPLTDAETLKISEDGFITEIGKKPKSYDEIEGQYIGLMKFSAAGVKILREHYHALDKNAIYDGKSYPNMYMTTLLQSLINSGVKVSPVFIDGGWTEVDEPTDLEYDLDVSSIPL